MDKAKTIENIMDTAKFMSHFFLAAAIVAGCFALQSAAIAQSSDRAQTPSDNGSALGDYARRVRKDDPGKAKPKVFDNDNLPHDDKLSVVGQPAPGDATNTAAPEASGDNATTAAPATAAGETKPEGDKAAAAKTDDSAKDKEKDQQAAWKQWQDKLGGQKSQIDLLTRELDVLQREYQIRAAGFYADAGNRLRNQGAWDKQDADYKQQIADKQKALDDAKQKLDDMGEDARKAGVPASMRE